MPEEGLQKRYEALPEELKKTLADKEISNNVYRIGGELKVPQEKMETLAQIVGKVFLGIVSLKNLKNELENDLEISSESAEELYQSLYQNIFLGYKEILENLTSNFPPTKEDVSVSPPPIEQNEEEIKIRKELLKRKGVDKYREPIDEDELEEQKPRIVKENGKIKKIF